MSYNAQRGCARLSDFIKENEESSPTPKEERERALMAVNFVEESKFAEVVNPVINGIAFVKNLNKRHDKDFYVAYKGDE